jgi:hypothetical protein
LGHSLTAAFVVDEANSELAAIAAMITATGRRREALQRELPKSDFSMAYLLPEITRMKDVMTGF